MGGCRHRLRHGPVRATRAGLNGMVGTDTGAGAACARQTEHLLIRGVERRAASRFREVVASGGLRQPVSASWRDR